MADRWPALVVYNVPGQYIGGYLWDERKEQYVEITVPCSVFMGPVTGQTGSPWTDATLVAAIEALEDVQRDERLRRKLIDLGQRRAPANIQGGSSATSVPALVRPANASRPASRPARPAPTPRPVIQTVYREVQTPSRLMQLVESRLGWLLFGALVLGILAGFVIHGSRSREIVISAEEHARAAAQLEQRLRADALRIKKLSSAVDQEEARYIQRVSAITRRS